MERPQSSPAARCSATASSYNVAARSTSPWPQAATPRCVRARAALAGSSAAWKRARASANRVLGQLVVAVILGDHAQEQERKGQQPRVIDRRRLRQARLEPGPGLLVVALEMGQEPRPDRGPCRERARHVRFLGRERPLQPGPSLAEGSADVPEPGQRPGQTQERRHVPASSSHARAARRLARSASSRSSQGSCPARWRKAGQACFGESRGNRRRAPAVPPPLPRRPPAAPARTPGSSPACRTAARHRPRPAAAASSCRPGRR